MRKVNGWKKKKNANPPREPTANISVLSSKLVLA